MTERAARQDLLMEVAKQAISESGRLHEEAKRWKEAGDPERAWMTLGGGIELTRFGRGLLRQRMKESVAHE